jgi:hypothetical protein
MLQELRGRVGSMVDTSGQVDSFDFARWLFIRGIMASMNTNRLDAERSLVATLARIDEQIVESDTLLLKSLTVRERHRVTDELAYLQTQRRGVAAKLPSKL